MRALVFALIASCWSGYVEIETPRPARRVVKTRPGCWTKHFYEEWPTYADWTDVYTGCRTEWEATAPEQIDTCVATRYHYAYEDWVAWTQRWWEACAGE